MLAGELTGNYGFIPQDEGTTALLILLSYVPWGGTITVAGEALMRVQKDTVTWTKDAQAIPADYILFLLDKAKETAKFSSNVSIAVGTWDAINRYNIYKEDKFIFDMINRVNAVTKSQSLEQMLALQKNSIQFLHDYSLYFNPIVCGKSLYEIYAELAAIKDQADKDMLIKRYIGAYERLIRNYSNRAGKYPGFSAYIGGEFKTGYGKNLSAFKTLINQYSYMLEVNDSRSILYQFTNAINR